MGSMRPRRIIFLATFWFFLAISTSLFAKEDLVQSGVLDLEINPIQGKSLKLDGDWEFYWKQLLPPEDHIRRNTNPKYWKVPQIWNTYIDSSNTSQPNMEVGGMGYASYRLVIRSPVENIAGLKIPDLATAYRAYWNGELIAKAGVVGDKQTHVPQYYLSLEQLPVKKGENELLIHVSNYSHYKGGVWEKLRFGDWATVRMDYIRNLASELFLAGAILIMSIYHFGIYFLRRKEKTALYFAIFCLFITIRILTVGERFLLILFPDINWQLGMSLEYNSYYFPPIFFLLFVNAVYPKYIHPYFLLISMYITLGFFAMILVIPSTIYPHLNTYFHPVTVAIIVAACYTVARARIDKKEGSTAFMLGLIPIVIATINDILFSMLIVETFQMISIGLFLFIFSQSFILSMRFSRAFRDVERYSTQLVSLDKMKDEVLVNTSQEFRSPLNGIIGITESMIDGATGEITSTQKSNLALILSSGKRLSSLVNDILDFSKIKNGDLHLDRKTVDIITLINLVLTTTKPLILSKNLKVIRSSDNECTKVYGDEERLQQILYNLIGNSIKFTEQGSIHIHTSKNHGELIVSIKDTGIGISEDRFSEIFFSFEQGKYTTDKEYGGAGLGLAITKKLIELHDGKIWVESKLGEGSTFYFSLPSALEECESLHIDPVPIKILTNSMDALEEYSKKNKPIPIDSDEFSILVVDDEPINRQVLKNILTQENYHIWEANSGKEALEVIASGSIPDLVILDVMMPIMNGYEVSAEIRKIYNLQELPIILLTSKNQIHDIVTGLESGANDYVAKPFDKRELITRVKNLLTLKRAIEEKSKYISFQNELQIAKNLQASILPEKAPSYPGIHFAYDYTPMEQVGGDFFDFYEVDDNRVGVIIADVSGHGVPAALVASMFKIASSIQFERTGTPADLLKRINKTLYGKTKKAFITASYIEIHIKERKLLHSRAGHPPMLFLDKNSDESYQSLPSGMTIGWFDETEHSIEELPLFGAKRIALYTDGIIEARSPSGELYTTERFIDILKKTKTWDTHLAMAHIKEDIFHWTTTTNLEDDLTLILIDIDFD